jgi:hypothetical protein
VVVVAGEPPPPRPQDADPLERQAQPGQVYHRLTVHFDESLKWTEIYRAIRMLARLSGGEEHEDWGGSQLGAQLRAADPDDVLSSTEGRADD